MGTVYSFNWIFLVALQLWGNNHSFSDCEIFTSYKKKIFRILKNHFLWIPKYSLNPFSCYYLLVSNDSTEWLCFCFWSEMSMHFHLSWCCAQEVSDAELGTVTGGRPLHWWDINFRVAPLLCVWNWSPLISIVTDLRTHTQTLSATLSRILCWLVICVCTCARVWAQLCPTLCNPMDCSPPGSSVHGIFQARVLEWVAIAFSRIAIWPSNPTSGHRSEKRKTLIWKDRLPNVHSNTI